MVVGTRPEAIKLAPVAAALTARGLKPALILTGQHPGLDPAAFGLAGLPAENLRCPGRADPHAHVRVVTKALVPLLKQRSCDLLIVQGDTSSAVAGALAARIAGVPLAHVEAGLRTHDARLPWPEECFRVAIDRRADLLFAPTATNAANLTAEQVEGAVHVTGNSGIDALVAVTASLPRARARFRDRGQPMLLANFHRRESWGPGFEAIASALRTIAAEGVATVEVVLHPNPHLAARARRLLGQHRNIRLREPCSHQEMIAAMLECTLMLSDSGGVQEEAPALGVPLLVLRDKTERPEGVAAGNMELVGTDPARIVAAVRRLLADPLALATMSRPTLPFGDGRAAPRIAAIIARWLATDGDNRGGAYPLRTCMLDSGGRTTSGRCWREDTCQSVEMRLNKRSLSFGDRLDLLLKRQKVRPNDCQGGIVKQSRLCEQPQGMGREREVGEQQQVLKIFHRVHGPRYLAPPDSTTGPRWGRM